MPSALHEVASRNGAWSVSRRYRLWAYLTYRIALSEGCVAHHSETLPMAQMGLGRVDRLARSNTTVEPLPIESGRCRLLPSWYPRAGETLFENRRDVIGIDAFLGKPQPCRDNTR